MNKNILISSAGKRVGLLKAFQSEAGKIDRNIHVLACDAKPELAPACYISEKALKVPRIDSPEFIDRIKEYCINEKIGLVIPTIDTELLILSKHHQDFLEIGTQIVISEIEFIKICRDKRSINNFFINNNILIPEQYSLDKLKYPVFIKPYDGSCSVDTHLILSPGELGKVDLSDSKYMFMQYMDPKEYVEYTLDMYYDKYSSLKCIVPRKRIEVRSGEINKGITLKNEVYTIIAQKLANIQGARGCITLQLFVNRSDFNDIYGIEINPRFGGGYPLSYYAKANFPSWIIHEYIYNKKIAFFDEWKQNLLMLRYDEEVLIPDYHE